MRSLSSINIVMPKFFQLLGPRLATTLKTDLSVSPTTVLIKLQGWKRPLENRKCLTQSPTRYFRSRERVLHCLHTSRLRKKYDQSFWSSSICSVNFTQPPFRQSFNVGRLYLHTASIPELEHNQRPPHPSESRRRSLHRIFFLSYNARATYRIYNRMYTHNLRLTNLPNDQKSRVITNLTQPSSRARVKVVRPWNTWVNFFSNKIIINVRFSSSNTYCI